jgi:hypothetical protein
MNAEKKAMVQGETTQWEKIFANHTSDKELISKIYEELKASFLQH